MFPSFQWLKARAASRSSVSLITFDLCSEDRLQVHSHATAPAAATTPATTPVLIRGSSSDSASFSGSWKYGFSRT
ncbi:hypothetical protein VTJ04DRAFT_5170 [Mycothermus thermophilus]|uniref:uncharacterized protein n=1 Tax=Humicola insolens TaxID=85995 RepID=UPI0037438B0C